MRRGMYEFDAIGQPKFVGAYQTLSNEWGCGIEE
jgi:hypothetical protein